MNTAGTRILITGASGLIGSALIPVLKRQGHHVFRAVRTEPAGDDEIRWRPLETPQQLPASEREAFEGFDTVIHLAGENIASHRWTDQRKQEIRSSRVEATTNLAALLGQLSSGPSEFISASAVGGYPADSDEILTEQSAFGRDYLAEVCRDWESASDSLAASGVRVVKLRIGIVLSPAGGILERLVPLFRWCLGSRIGSGKQWMSWIDLDDLVEIVKLVSTTKTIEGPINCVAPAAVRNVDFTTTLAAILRRPVAPPVPAFIIRLLYGEMGQSLILEGRRVLPARLMQLGYHFKSPDLPSALRNQFH
ncbi:MAG: TIGR01777 family oxidoreductase [Planctomycetota bacterium]